MWGGEGRSSFYCIKSWALGLQNALQTLGITLLVDFIIIPWHTVSSQAPAHPETPAQETPPRKTAPSATTRVSQVWGPFPPPDSPGLRKVLQLSISEGHPTRVGAETRKPQAPFSSPEDHTDLIREAGTPGRCEALRSSSLRGKFSYRLIQMPDEKEEAVF